MPETKTYMAKSAYTDLTNISAFIMAVLQLNGVEKWLDWFSTVLVSHAPEGMPLNLVKLLEFVAAVTIIIHRTFYANNPVDHKVAPGNVKPVEVRSLTATMPPDPPKE